jgi:hypothetical protein
MTHSRADVRTLSSHVAPSSDPAKSGDEGYGLGLTIASENWMMDNICGLKRREGTLGVEARSMREMRAVVSRASDLAVTRGGRICH